MGERLLVSSVAVVLLAISGCGSTSGHAGQPATATLDPVTENSTCAEWNQATTAQQTQYARLVAPGIEIPAKYKEGEVADAYTYGLVAGRCHQAETTGTANQVTLGKLLDTAASLTASASEPAPSDDFLKPGPAVTIGNEQDGRWSVALDSSVLSAQPLSGSAPTGPTDRLLEVRLTVTYLTPGPPGSIGEEGVQLDELPSDLGLKHVPTPEEEDAETPESKAIDCGQAEIKNLCDVIGRNGATWALYTEENEAPGGAISPSELAFVEPNQSESFWLVAHLSEHVQPSHIVLAIDGQPLSAMPKG
jgi:hypothetical protein